VGHRDGGGRDGRLKSVAFRNGNGREKIAGRATDGSKKKKFRQSGKLSKMTVLWELQSFEKHGVWGQEKSC